ncbi:ABC transporter ATP-binding protein [Saccharothrix isguenensis]
MGEFVIETRELRRDFAGVQALDGLSLRVARGTVLGLLGHNGAGKTTLVNVLSTLLPPTSGTATVAGFDVVREAAAVRSRIGLTGQFAALDDQLTGADNLRLVARLLGARRAGARAQADALLEQFGLTAVAHRPVRTYSGGMRRRLDLAVSLAGRPEVLFLDEPTTGLDPESRARMWEVVLGLVADGATVLMTTQYLEEADRLADAVVVLAEGRIAAEGTPAELKRRVGVRTAHLTVTEASDDFTRAADALRAAGLAAAGDASRRELSVPVERSDDLVRLIHALDAAEVGTDGMTVAEPTLDDVYLAIARDTAASGRDAMNGSR